MCEKTDFIIRSRIQQYKEDIEYITEEVDEYSDDQQRIKQDQVIIKELEAILYGTGLERLHYVS